MGANIFHLNLKVFNTRRLKVLDNTFKTPFVEFHLVQGVKSYSHLKMDVFAKIAIFGIFDELPRSCNPLK